LSTSWQQAGGFRRDISPVQTHSSLSTVSISFLEETVVAIISSEEILGGSGLETEMGLGVDATVTVTVVVVVNGSVVVVVTAELMTADEDVETTNVVLASASIVVASELLASVEIIPDAATVIVVAG